MKLGQAMYEASQKEAAEADAQADAAKAARTSSTPTSKRSTRTEEKSRPDPDSTPIAKGPARCAGPFCIRPLNGQVTLTGV